MNIKSIFIATCTTMSILLLCPLTTECGPKECSESKWGYSYNEFDHYSVSENLVTPQGIRYDSSGQNISPLLIDRLTQEVEECLHQPIDRHSFVVKIPNDWVLSCDQSEQVLPTPVRAGGAGCISKGLDPNEQCPCRWRAGIQCPNVLISTPNLLLYKDILIRFITGNPNPWSNSELSTCATPTTTALSDGSDPNNGK